MFVSKGSNAISTFIAVGVLLQSALANPVAGLGYANIKRASEASGPGCGENEIAVGTYKTCSPAPSINPVIPPDGGCGAEYGALWQDSNCDGDHWSLSGMTEGFCKGGFKEDIEVKCNDKGEAQAMYSKGHLIPWLSNCRPHSVKCTRTIGIASAYSEIKYCCGV